MRFNLNKMNYYSAKLKLITEFIVIINVISINEKETNYFIIEIMTNEFIKNLEDVN